MPVIDTYAYRNAESTSEKEDVYEYNRIPKQLRVQIKFILESSIGGYYRYTGYEMGSVKENNEAWDFIHNTLCREFGELSLAKRNNPRDDCISFIQEEQDVKKWLSLVELAIRYVDNSHSRLSDYDLKAKGITEKPRDAIYELNTRFKRACFGYQYDSGTIIKISDEFTHEEIIKPCLGLLRSNNFKGANKEFLEAHKHFREGEYKDAILDANKAFESVMKIICDAKGYNYNKGAVASDLVKTLSNNGFFPQYMTKSFEQLIAVLKSGLPVVRNNEGSHGEGSTTKNTPEHVALFAINMAASKIVFLVQNLKDCK